MSAEFNRFGLAALRAARTAACRAASALMHAGRLQTVREASTQQQVSPSNSLQGLVSMQPQ